MNNPTRLIIPYTIKNKTIFNTHIKNKEIYRLQNTGSSHAIGVSYIAKQVAVLLFSATTQVLVVFRYLRRNYK
jgi:hypothetical protein